MFDKVLVANRGEIAVRIIRALRELGAKSVAVYSEVDRGALHVRMADEALPIGPAPSTESYLRIDRIIDAARRSGAQAIHPGYGFLSENAEFCQACQDAGIRFVGPPPEAVARMGLKTEARKLAIAAGAPVVPGTENPAASFEDALNTGRRVGFPILLKAAAGGGGKGMRLVNSEAGFEAAYRDASSEAERAFGNGALYVERAVTAARHIEIQVLGDHYGHMVHLGERECSIQRRHQKVIEECPSPLSAARPALRREMGEAALRIARAAGYVNAGTVEFLVDPGGNYYFLEMNTRLQVEHPITELVTSVDLVHWQLRIAAGERLTLKQEDIAWRGAAIECRICAEDPDNNFYPSPGRILQLERPAGPGIRLDSGVYAGWTVPTDYDPLLAKIAVWGETRELAISRMLRALSEYYVAGITTNLSFFAEVLRDSEFAAGRLHTRFLDEYFQRRHAASGEPDGLLGVASLVAAVHENRIQPSQGRSAPTESAWLRLGRRGLLQ